MTRRQSSPPSRTAPRAGVAPHRESLAAELEARGFARVPRLLSATACRELTSLYALEERFRSRVDMGPRAYGEGQYSYFSYPLPAIVQTLRDELYALLAPIANRWMDQLGGAARYPPRLEAFLARCRRAGQHRPTPLVLRYEAEGYNCLHRDLYGELAFPLQVAILLSQPDRDFAGGEFLLVENRPRQQARAEVVPLARGEGVIFPVNERPAPGARGLRRVAMRHGVSRVLRGRRFALGIIFHDAR